MVIFFDIAEGFLSCVIRIGDFLLLQPFDISVDAARSYYESVGVHIPDWFYNFYSFLFNLNVAEMLLGGGLIGILVFKLVKFFVGIVTGS